MKINWTLENVEFVKSNLDELLIRYPELPLKNVYFIDSTTLYSYKEFLEQLFEHIVILENNEHHHIKI